MKNIIFDTDFSSDIDDCGDLLLLLGLHKVGAINLIGVVISSSNNKSPGVVNAICTYMGFPSIPIGCWKGAPNDTANQGPGTWVGPTYDNYPHAYGLASTVEGSLSLYQRLIANSPGRVTIIATGGAPALNELMAASPTLVATVRELVWACGSYPIGSGEFNINYDVPAATAIMANWPTPITYSGYENGVNIITGGNLTYEFASNEIRRYAYSLHWTGGAGRSAWGQQAVLWAVFGSSMFNTVKGSNAVVAVSANSFTQSANGKDQFTVMALAETTYGAIINNYISMPAASSPTAWKYGRSLLKIN